MYEEEPDGIRRAGPGARAEMVLRLLVLKHVRMWSFVTLEREVRSERGVSRVHADRRRSGPRCENHGPVGRGLLVSAAWWRRSFPRRSGSA